MWIGLQPSYNAPRADANAAGLLRTTRLTGTTQSKFSPIHCNQLVLQLGHASAQADRLAADGIELQIGEVAALSK